MKGSGHFHCLHEQGSYNTYRTIAVKSQFLTLTMSKPWTSRRRPLVSPSVAKSLVGSTRMKGGVFVRKFFAFLSSPNSTRFVVTPRNFQTRLDSVKPKQPTLVSG